MDTERDRRIHFRNEPFMARVAGCSEQPIQCIPVIFDEEYSCGVGVLYPDGNH